MLKVHVCTKFWVRTSNGSAVRALTEGETHIQTDGTDFKPSTADAGGNEYLIALLVILFHIGKDRAAVLDQNGISNLN